MTPASRLLLHPDVLRRFANYGNPNPVLEQLFTRVTRRVSRSSVIGHSSFSTGSSQRSTKSAQPAMSVTLHTTLGPLKIELFVEACPKTCENFLALAASGYFDDVPFHRNLAGFITQTGDGELKTGKGGKSIWGGFFEDEISPALRHNARGIVSMANKGENTNASQFFVTYAAQKHLDGRNTVFGKVWLRADVEEGGLKANGGIGY